MFRLADTWRSLSPNTHFMRKISLIFLTVSILCAMLASLFVIGA